MRGPMPQKGDAVGLLGMPRRPAVRQVYEMPPVYYDRTDDVGHPVLVISVDLVTRMATIVTRTTSPHARGDNAIVHAAQPDLGLLDVGWWRMKFPKPVGYTAFDEPDVKHRGELDEVTWEKMVRQMKGVGE
jgi:hypothetical protein